MTAPWLEPVLGAIVKRAARDALPHAMLLLGPERAAAWTGERLSRALLCLGPEPGLEGCGDCRSCHLFDAGTHSDYQHMESESKSGQIKVDQIRELVDGANLTASVGPRRVHLVEGADAMNRSAANALLKTLEEPPAGTVILLTASQRSRLPATIFSRCQVYPLPPAGAAGADWLRARVEGLDEGHIDQLLETAGDPFAALALCEAAEGNAFTLLTEPLERLVERLIRGDADLPQLAADWNDDLADLRLARLARFWRDCLAQRLGYGAPDMASAGLTADLDLASLLRYYEQTVETRRLLGTSVRGELQIESLLAEVQQAHQATREQK